MQKTSGKKIIDLIYRDFKPTDSNWVGDAWDMIGEAVEGIGYHLGFDRVKDTVMVANKQVKWPRNYTEIKFIEYNELRLPLGGDVTDAQVGSSAEDTINLDPYRVAKLEELVTRWNNLEDSKEGSSPAEVIEIQALQDELMVDITKLVKELEVKTPKDAVLGHYYLLSDGYITTSFNTGKITVYGTSFPVDENKVPLIIDTYKYRNACFFKVASLLLLQGYKHPSLDYATADAKWEFFRAQASNEPRIMGLARQDRFAKLWTRYKFDPYESSTFFKYTEQ